MEIKTLIWTIEVTVICSVNMKL